MGILDSVAIATKRQNRLGLAIGCALGGFVPIATCVVAHYETGDTPLKWILVAGGLAYSAATVLAWGRVAFGSFFKAAGFVALLEGVTIFSTTPALVLAALGSLVAINAIATASRLIAERAPARRARKPRAKRKPSRPAPLRIAS